MQVKNVYKKTFVVKCWTFWCFVLISDRPFANVFYFLRSATSWSYCIKASHLVQGVTLEYGADCLCHQTAWVKPWRIKDWEMQCHNGLSNWTWLLTTYMILGKLFWLLPPILLIVNRNNTISLVGIIVVRIIC